MGRICKEDAREAKKSVSRDRVSNKRKQLEPIATAVSTYMSSFCTFVLVVSCWKFITVSR